MSAVALPMPAYLERIGLHSLPAATPKGLAQLVRAQRYSLAFENLDVLANVPVRLDLAAIADKVLQQGRGGYCFELNGLLAGALDAAGFSFRTALARVIYRRAEPGPLSHVTLRVDCDGEQWLVDAGFGGPGLIEPVLFRTGREFVQNGASFRLLAEDDGDIQLQRRIAGTWTGLYLLSTRAVLPVDLEAANHFVSTWERSPFRSRLMCALPTPHGLMAVEGTDVVLLNPQLMPVKSDPLDSAEALQSVMLESFGVRVQAGIAERAWNAATGCAKQ